MTDCFWCGQSVKKIPGDYWRYMNEEGTGTEELMHNECVQERSDLLEQLRELAVKARAS